MKIHWRATFGEGRSTLDHILTFCTLIEHEAYASRCLDSCFVDFKKYLDMVPRNKLWDYLQHLGGPLHLQQVVNAMYTIICAKVWINGDTHGEVMLVLVLNKDVSFPPSCSAYTLMNLKHIWTRLTWFSDFIYYGGCHSSLCWRCCCAIWIKIMLTKTCEQVTWAFHIFLASMLIYIRTTSWYLVATKEN